MNVDFVNFKVGCMSIIKRFFEVTITVPYFPTEISSYTILLFFKLITVRKFV
jgi:hypothetical protein